MKLSEFYPNEEFVYTIEGIQFSRDYQKIDNGELYIDEERNLYYDVGFNRIAAMHDVRNPNSGAVMKKCGMQYEGTYREARLTKEGDLLT